MSKFKTVLPTDKHQEFSKALKACMKANVGDLSAMEVLAIVSQLVGNLIALQDQTKVTPEMAMKLVSQNIQEGNLQAVQQLMSGDETWVL